MKSPKILAAIIVAVLLIGGYGATRYVENAVVAKVRELEQLASPKIHVGNARFSLLNRRLDLSDVRVEVNGGAPDAMTYDIGQAVAFIPLGLLFDTPTGPALLLDEAELRDMTVRTAQAVQTTTEQKIVRLSADLPRIMTALHSGASEQDKALEIAFALSYESWTGRDMHVDIPAQKDAPHIVCTAEQTRSAGYDKGNFAFGEYSGLKIFVKELPTASLDTMSIKNFRMPSPAALKAVQTLTPDADEEQVREAVFGLFSGPEPLFGQLLFKNFKITLPVLPLSLDSLVVDWTSNTPLSGAYALDNLALPTQLLALAAPQIKLPGLSTLHMDAKGAFQTDADGVERNQQTLTLRDIATLTADVRVRDNKTSLSDPTLRLKTIKLVSADVVLEDKRLLAYVGGNLNPSGVGVPQMMEQITGAVAAQIFPEQKAAEVMTQLKSFIQKPGTLKIALMPKEPTPLFSLQNPAVLSPALTVSATPGSTPLEQEIRQLFAPTGK